MSRVTVTKDSVTRVIASISELVNKDVLIGIPESTSDRDDDGSGEMTNAALGFIHEFGSPAANIPARPFLIPGVEKVEDKATDQMKEAAQAALAGDRQKSDASLERAGFIAEMSARREISTGNFAPLKPATIRNRRRGRGTKSRRAAEEQYMALIKGGAAPADAQAAAGIRALIDTGQLRNSITHVVRKK